MQQRVLEVLRSAPSHLNLGGLAARLGISYPTFSQHLDALAKKGLIELRRRGPGQTPIVTLPEDNAQPIQWRPMSEPLPAALAKGEVLLLTWHDGIVGRVEAWDSSEWYLHPMGREYPEAWTIIRVPMPDEDLLTIPGSIDTSPAHVEGVDR